MQIVIRPVGWCSSEFEYNKNTTIVSPLIQHLSNVFGDKARIYSDSSLQSSSFLGTHHQQQCLQYNYLINQENNGYQIACLIR